MQKEKFVHDPNQLFPDHKFNEAEVHSCQLTNFINLPETLSWDFNYWQIARRQVCNREVLESQNL